MRTEAYIKAIEEYVFTENQHGIVDSTIKQVKPFNFK